MPTTCSRPNALDIVVRQFAANPHAAVIYGACDMIDGDRRFLHSWTPPEFDLLGLMEGAVVPPFATSFFSRARCGDDLSFDEEFRTVADFDLWLRLAHLPIVRILDVLADVRVGEQSSTWNAANYDNQSGFKIRALKKLLERPGPGPCAGENVRARGSRHLSLGRRFDGGHQRRTGKDRSLFREGDETDLRSERFRDVLARARPPRLPPASPPASDPTLGMRLLQCGIEYLRKCRPDTALAYFEYLQAAGFEAPELDRWLARGKKDRWEAQTQTEVAEHLQAEVNRRDRLLAEKEAWWSNEVVIRDAIIDDLRREQELDAARLAPVDRRPAAGARNSQNKTMCGIVGSFKPGGASSSPDVVARMRDQMAHRGPDGAGIWCAPDRSCTLGHRRLSIIDLSTAPRSRW